MAAGPEGGPVVERSRWLGWQKEETLGFSEEEKERNLWSSNFPVHCVG